MVRNRWNDQDAAAFTAKGGDDAADQALMLRVYSSRLIGIDPDLVMHGGGNTSVKVKRQTLFGETVDVLHVKGSGWDLETIEAPGLPGVRMNELMALRALPRLSDEDMVNMQRCNLLDSTAPNPSVETLLHAYLPHRFVDHTHATAMLALANLPNVAEVTREIFGNRVVLVPYIMPGFALAKEAARIFEENPHVEGILLVNHGHFTFGDSAKQSYDRMIDHVNAVESWFAARAKPLPPAPSGKGDAASILPQLRGALAASLDKDKAMPVLDLRAGDDVLRFLERQDLAALASRGVATPDHVIRTKAFPLLLDRKTQEGGAAAFQEALSAYAERYKGMFARQNARVGGGKTMLAPMPGLLWLPGIGLVGIGADAAAARIAADLGEQTLRVMAMGEDAGGFHSIGEDDLFDMEYWSLEQAKLGKGTPPRLRGRVVLVTGGAGAIGLATAQAFKALGASLFLIDRDAAQLEKARASLGRDHGALVCDLTVNGGPKQAVAACCARFGGVDIIVSNAGAAWTGDVATLPDETLRQSFELNFFAHQALAQAAVAVFRAQGRGGQLLFNVSKQAVNPGKGFGAYGLPKAATFFLVKQLALELGGEGVRVNGINADRIRSGLLTDDFIAERSKARGVDESAYMAGNLIKREVEARHVAEGFVMLALAERTTAHVLTVDGGNIEASLR